MESSKTGLFLVTVFLLICQFTTPAGAFDNDELEIFDLVEEVNQNFYEYMGLDPDGSATTNDIRKSYKKLAVVLHPDKSDAEDAEIKFRWLASIYDVLRDSKKREIYNRVLVEGLPNWKNPVFYYRRMRKIGLFEGVVYTLVLTSLIQYAMHWASYFERKFTLQENLGEQLNKRSTQKKFKSAKKDLDQDRIMSEHMESLGVLQPSVWNLLPFTMVKLSWAALLAAPTLPSQIYNAIKEHREEQEAIRRQEKEEEEEAERREQEKKDRKEKLRQRKMQKPKYEEREYAGNGEAPPASAAPTGNAEKEKAPRNARQLWTDDQLAKLARLMKKFPGGTQDRWETIAEAMERYPWEITKMAANVKNSMHMAPSQTAGNQVPGLDSETNNHIDGDTESDCSATEDSQEDSESDSEEEVGYTVASKADYVPVEVKAKTKTRKEESQESSETQGCEIIWTQVQQKSFEQAIKQFPKGTPERWERIAGKVQGKSTDECIQRFKFLAEKVKAKRVESQAS